ncbi:MAG: sigma-70 family RNA polymerase sigma factor, partial [Planctomycetota bacterium]|nr:sigma-70 family RNA polymerase sigma factor [Planctomycetota bacterium]
MESLEALLDRYLAERDERAIETLVARTKPRLLTTARRIAGATDAEDCVQTAYLSLMHRRREHDAPVLPWLITAVVRIAYSHKAQQRKQRALAERLRQVPEPDALEGVVRRDEAERLRAHVAQLPGSYRDPVVLHYFHGLDAAEVGTLLELTPATVRKRLERARKLLRGRWPRVAGYLFAIPWFLTEHAAAAVAGGLVMKKAALAVGGVALVAALGATWWTQRSEPRERTRSPQPAPRRLAVETEENRTAPAAKEVPGPRSGFAGVVVDETGQAVSGARVEFRKSYRRDGRRVYIYYRDEQPTARRSTRTDGDGRFSVTPYRNDESIVAVYVHVIATGRALTFARIERDKSMRIVLTTGARLRVSVRDEDDRPADGVSVRLCPAERAPRTVAPTPGPVLATRPTGANGSTSFHVAAGTYRLELDVDGYVPTETEPFALAAGDATAREFTLRRGIQVDIQVVDEEDRPIAGADVELRGPRSSGHRTKTDENGRCAIAGIAPPAQDAGHWYRCMYWHVEAPGFAPTPGDRVLPFEAGHEKLTVRMRRGVPVSLRVVDSAGAGVPKAWIAWTYNRNAANPIRRRFSTETDATGRAELPRHGPGERELGVRKDRVYKAFTLKIGNTPVHEELVLATGTATVRGRILRPDGKPATSGRVGFAPDGAEPHALGMVCVFDIGTDGAFEANDVRVGRGRLYAIGDTYGAQSMPMTLGSGEVRDGVEFRLTEGLMISGRAVTRAGRPVGDLRLRLSESIHYPNGGQSSHDVAETRTGPDGTFSFRGLGEGDTFRVQVGGRAWRPTTMAPSVRAGDPEVVLRVKPGAEGSGLRLNVRLGDVRPDGLIQCMYHPPGQKLPHMMNGKKVGEGRYEFRFYGAPGTYDLEFASPGVRPFRVSGVMIEDKEEQPPIAVEFDRGAVLRLRVEDEHGAALAGTSLWIGNQ